MKGSLWIWRKDLQMMKQQGVNFKNTQITHTTHYFKKKSNPLKNMGRRPK